LSRFHNGRVSLIGNIYRFNTSIATLVIIIIIIIIIIIVVVVVVVVVVHYDESQALWQKQLVGNVFHTTAYNTITYICHLWTCTVYSCKYNGLPLAILTATTVVGSVCLMP